MRLKYKEELANKDLLIAKQKQLNAETARQYDMANESLRRQAEEAKDAVDAQTLITNELKAQVNAQQERLIQAQMTQAQVKGQLELEKTFQEQEKARLEGQKAIGDTISKNTEKVREGTASVLAQGAAVDGVKTKLGLIGNTLIDLRTRYNSLTDAAKTWSTTVSNGYRAQLDLLGKINSLVGSGGGGGAGPLLSGFPGALGALGSLIGSGQGTSATKAVGAGASIQSPDGTRIGTLGGAADVADRSTWSPEVLNWYNKQTQDLDKLDTATRAALESLTGLNFGSAGGGVVNLGGKSPSNGVGSGGRG
jgi:hypothetical protein